MASIGLTLRLFLVAFDVIDWYSYIYTPIYGNLDILLCGGLLVPIVMARKDAKVHVALKITSLCLFFLLFVLNCYVYWACETNIPFYLSTYRAAFPTLWIFASAFVLYCFPTHKKSPMPVRILAGGSFEVYVFHPFVSDLIFPHFENIGAFSAIMLILLVIVICYVGAYAFKIISHYIGVLFSFLSDLIKRKLTAKKSSDA